MGTAITIRDVPEETRDELARRPDADVLLAQLRERKSRTGTRLSAESILADRDADRR